MENQRIRLTKTMLKDALVSMLAEKSIEKITVQALCAQAQINRTTFYKYYGSQYDLLTDMENDFFNALESYLSEIGELPERDCLTSIMEFLAANQHDYRVLLLTAVDEEFVNHLFSLSAVRRVLRRALSSQYPPEMETYVCQFLCHGSYAIIRTWLVEGCREAPREMAELIYRIGTAMHRS